MKKIRSLANRQGVSFKRALNDVIRRGLASPASQNPQPRYTVEPHAGGFRAGIDPDKLNQLVDQLGDLTTDAHLAALAIEHQCELHSKDSDFARFPGLRWRNPL